MKEKILKVAVILTLIIFLVSILIASDGFLERFVIVCILIILIDIILKLLVFKPKNKFIKGIIDVVDCIYGWIILTLINLKAYATILLAVLLIFSMQLLPILIVFSQYMSIISYKSCIYIVAISTLVIISYKGYTIVDLFIKIYSRENGILSGYANYRSMDILEKLNLRKLSYEISITLYIITRVINLEGIKLSSTMDMQVLSNLIGEIFLTFVAIDCYICTFRKDIIEKINNKCLEIKEKYANIVIEEMSD